MAGGRPTDYDPTTHPKIVYALAKKGLTNIEIADGLGVATSTFHNWQNEHPEFLDAVKRGKEASDDIVEKSLYKRALGYTYTERKETLFAEGDLKTETTIKEVVPDVTAQIFWLKNRRPKEWRDRIQQELTGKDGGPIEQKVELSLSERMKKYEHLFKDPSE